MPIKNLITRIKGLFKSGDSSDEKKKNNNILSKPLNRRKAIGALAAGSSSAAAMAAAANSIDDKSIDDAYLKWEEYFKGNYRLMSSDEKQETIDRLVTLWENEHDSTISLSGEEPLENTLFGYAFNISKCQGYMDCVEACVKENNLDRDTGMQYIRIFEQQKGKMSLESANSRFDHEVPKEGHFYMGTQCFHCENPPCTQVCPVGATWKEKDGIVVVDYDWCIGCRYCEAACPYWGRRFNWKEPKVPEEEVNKNQHYLGNRMRRSGCMEKCTFCIQRTRKGGLPACAEACPTGARIFGNLLDPNSEIRYVLKHKKVFRLKEDLGTDPKYWYFMD